MKIVEPPSFRVPRIPSSMVQLVEVIAGAQARALVGIAAAAAAQAVFAAVVGTSRDGDGVPDVRAAQSFGEDAFFGCIEGMARRLR